VTISASRRPPNSGAVVLFGFRTRSVAPSSDQVRAAGVEVVLV